MKRLAFLLVFLMALPVYAAPRAFAAWGTATDVNAVITPTFNPSAGCIFNTDTTNDLYVNITGVPAVATSGGTTWRISAGKNICFGNGDPNVLNISTINVICSAGLTATYIVDLYRSR